MKQGMIILSLALCFIMIGCGRRVKETTEAAEVEENTKTVIHVFDGERYTHADSFSGGTGTEADPYEISNAEELALLQYILSADSEEEYPNDYEYKEAYYVITDDIELNDISDYEKWSEKEPQYGWVPIDGFRGHLDGQGHSVNGMFIKYSLGEDSASASQFIGLFGRVYDAEIRNLNMGYSYIIGNNIQGEFGGLAGEALDSVITSCQINAKLQIKTAYRVGGIIGLMMGESRITGCGYSGTINVERKDNDMLAVGGIAGDISASSYEDIRYNISITDSVNKADIICITDSVGGIVGEISIDDNTDASVVNCTNEGYIEGNEEIGGIVGNLTSFKGGKEKQPSFVIKECVNSGAVKAQKLAGGIIGNIVAGYSNISVFGNVNKGGVKSRMNSGGIIGCMTPSAYEAVIEECENYGEVTADQFSLGGILGSIKGNITTLSDYSYSVKLIHDYNCGTLLNEYGGVDAGGILGIGEFGSFEINIEECLNEGMIKVEKNGVYVGGILGYGDSGMIEDQEKTYNIRKCVNKGDLVIGDGVLLYGTDIGPMATGTDASEPLKKKEGSDDTSVGGIAGRFELGTIEGSVNTGSIYLNTYSLAYTTIYESTTASKRQEYSYLVACGGIAGKVHIIDHNDPSSERVVLVKNTYYTAPTPNDICNCGDKNSKIIITNTERCTQQEGTTKADNLTTWHK